MGFDPKRSLKFREDDELLFPAVIEFEPTRKEWPKF